MAAQASGSRYQLEVPIDATQVGERKPEQRVRVLAQGAKGPIDSHVVQLDEKGHGTARFSFASAPGSLTLYFGSEETSDEDLPRLQTMRVDVPARRWAGQSALKVAPIVISPYYWYWWWIWCRTFTICGRVVCPDGSPVVGANVCAYDVDWWWWWSSTQQIACATTDINGNFCMKFNWCCGWWDWWWWENPTRVWKYDEHLGSVIAQVLRRDPGLDALQPKAQPSLDDFQALLGAEGAHLSTAQINTATLAGMRERLAARLPAASPEIAQLKAWPWYPWYPWQDCNPDVIFKVTQNCTGTKDSTVIVNETVFDVRWDIPTTLNNVTLVANDQACCVHPGGHCPGSNCMVVTTICGDTVNHSGGNVGAPTAPLGYHNPMGSSVWSDQPYAETVPIGGIADCLNGVDYYECEWMTQAAYTANPLGPWNPMLPGGNGALSRTYWDSSIVNFGPAVPFAIHTFGTQNVYETLHHYEANNAPGTWGVSRYWINPDQLINWQTTAFGDGTYYLRFKGWTLAGNTLVNPQILDICGSNNPNYVVIAVDNRVVGPGPNDLHGNNCQTVHTCTNEPDTAIISITILQDPSNGGGVIPVTPCGSFQVKWPDKIQIDLVANDPNGHLGQYGLATHWGVNLSRNLLTLLGATLSQGPAWGGVLPAVYYGPTYANAFSSLQGGPGIRPTWNGGAVRLVAWATDDPSDPVNHPGAFPVTCCYQLRLDAWKRTLVNCSAQHTNTSETSFTITVLP